MSREEVLGRIRRSLHRKGPLPAGVAQGLERRTNQSAPHILPVIAEGLLERFVSKVEAVAGTTVTCKSGAGISEAVVEFLASRRLPMRIVVSDDELIQSVLWSNRLDVIKGLKFRIPIGLCYFQIIEAENLPRERINRIIVLQNASDSYCKVTVGNFKFR